MINQAQTGPSVADRRADLRETASDKVKIVGSDGHALDAEVVDRSLRGLRIRLTEATTIPREVHVLSVTRQAIYTAQVVWRTPPYAGLSISGATDMRILPTPGSARMHKMWREHMSR